MWSYLIVGFFCLVVCHGFPGGAPSSACNSWVPKHSGTSQQEEETFPYKVVASTEQFDVNNGNQNITVTIDSPDEETLFKGFVIAAFNEEAELTGDWAESKEVKKMSKCKGAATHTNGKAKSHVTLTWVPPADVEQGEVQFRVSVLKNFKTYWNFLPVPAKE